MKLNVKFTIIIVTFVLIPIIIFSMVLFRSMEDNFIKERRSAMEYSISKSHGDIIKNIDFINISTQFFLSDKPLENYLVMLKNGEEISYKEMIDFYHVNVSYLERMISNNPSLYQVRVYVDHDNMEEMMPLLYRYSRMKRLSWGEDGELRGWKFDYPDTIFDTFINQKRNIMSLVTPIEVFKHGRIGILEAAVYMDTMFPIIYEEEQELYVGFIDGEGNLYCKEERREELEYYLLGVKRIHEEEFSTMEEPYIDYIRLHKEPVIAGIQHVKELGGALIYVDNLQESIGAIHFNRNLFIFLLLFISFLLIIIINLIVKRLFKQFYSILTSIREVQKGDLNVYINDCKQDEMGELGTQINKMLERIRQLMEDNLNRERLVKNSEIRSLQNQINAHFIYNVLESIKMMAEIKEEYKISDAITSLGKLLRYSMRWTSGIVTVEEELEYVRNYMSLINLRFDYEVYLSLNIPDILLKQEIPKMSLQPIIENSIYHGIEEMAEDTNIYIKGILAEKDFYFEITDAGRGMSEEKVTELNRKLAGEIEADGGSGNGIGLKNVQDRIKMNFGETYGITVSSKLGCYTKIQLRLPIRM